MVRRLVLTLMLVLAAFAALAPALEAGRCESSCLGDGECAQELCCSCCVHFKVDPPRGASEVAGLSATSPVFARPARRPAAPDPREVLHVPKALAPQATRA